MERWRPVPDWEGLYEVSDKGRVRSVDRVVQFADGRTRRYRGRVLKLKLNVHGYPLAPLCRGEVKRWALVHRLVLTAFVGPCPAEQEGCHNDGDPTNAKLRNLRWDTRKANHADKRKHGTMLCGATHPSAIYDDRLVKRVIAAKGTATIDQLAARFGLSRTHIWNIQNGKRRANG